jgi:hypothetical protein
VVIVLGALFVALGPMSKGDPRESVGADMGPLGTAGLSRPEIEGELGDDAGHFAPDAEERLDQQNE